MKLHIGGEQAKEGWKIFSIQKKDNVDFVGNISDLNQFKTESIDEIYASHVLEHVGRFKVASTLEGIHRVLKKKGKFYVSVPDMDILAHAFVSPLASAENKFRIMRMMFGGQIDEYDFHYFGWNFEFLRDYLKKAGFSEFKKVDLFGLFEDTSDYKLYGFPVSLNLIATK